MSLVGDYGRDINVSVYEGRVKFSKPKSTSSKTYLTEKIRGFFKSVWSASSTVLSIKCSMHGNLMPKRGKQLYISLIFKLN